MFKRSLISMLLLLSFSFILPSFTSHAQDDEGKRFSISLSDKNYFIQGRKIYLLNDGKDTTLALFPDLTPTMFKYYFPDDIFTDGRYPDPTSSRNQVMVLDPMEISAVFVLDDEIWVGFGFYDGEGWSGIGGIGFFNIKTKEIGILRHPSLLYCSTSDLYVTPDSIYIKTIGNYEGVTTIGTGIVILSINTLCGRAMIPQGDDRLFDNDPSNGPGGNPIYERSLSRLLFDSTLVSKKISDWPEETTKIINSIGGRNYMIHTAHLEYELNK